MSDYSDEFKGFNGPIETDAFELEAEDVQISGLDLTKTGAVSEHYSTLASHFLTQPIETLITETLVRDLDIDQIEIDKGRIRISPRSLQQCIDNGIELMHLINSNKPLQESSFSGMLSHFIDQNPALMFSSEKVTQAIQIFITNNIQSIALVNALYHFNQGDLKGLSEALIDSFDNESIKPYIIARKTENLAQAIKEPETITSIKKNILKKSPTLQEWMNKNQNHLLSLISKKYQEEIENIKPKEITNKIIAKINYVAEIKQQNKIISSYQNIIENISKTVSEDFLPQGALSIKNNTIKNSLDGINHIQLKNSNYITQKNKMIEELFGFFNSLKDLKDKNIHAIAKTLFNNMGVDPTHLLNGNITKEKSLTNNELNCLINTHKALYDYKIIQQNASEILNSIKGSSHELQEHFNQAYQIVFCIKKSLSGDENAISQLIFLKTIALSMKKWSPENELRKMLVDSKNPWVFKGLPAPLQYYIGKLLKNTSFGSDLIKYDDNVLRLSLSQLSKKLGRVDNSLK